MSATERPPPAADAPPAEDAAGGIVRYGLFERILHWFVAVTFIYLMLSGFALGYPRMAWLYSLLGGGVTVRWLHAWVGVAFTVGVVVMLVIWLRENLFERTDAAWVKRMRAYAEHGHTGLDTGKYNPGQKGFFWFMGLATLLLLATGIPLWFPEPFSLGLLQGVRLVHHLVMIAFVLMFIVHVYLSAVMLPGTMSAMTTGKVSRAWAAHHHPRWFRTQQRDAAGDADAEHPA